MKKYKIPSSFFSDINDNWQPVVRIFAGRGCWQRAIDHRAEWGPGTAMALDVATDPYDLIYPASERCFYIDSERLDLPRRRRMCGALLRCKASAVIYDDGKELIQVRGAHYQSKVYRHNDGSLRITKFVAAIFKIHFEAGGRHD